MPVAQIHVRRRRDAWDREFLHITAAFVLELRKLAVDILPSDAWLYFPTRATLEIRDAWGPTFFQAAFARWGDRSCPDCRRGPNCPRWANLVEGLPEHLPHYAPPFAHRPPPHVPHQSTNKPPPPPPPPRLRAAPRKSTLERRARALLGVRETATPREIEQAFRVRIARAHPDKGGSHAEAKKVIAARALLLATDAPV